MIGIATSGSGFGEDNMKFLFWVFFVWRLIVLLVTQRIMVFHIRSELQLDNIFYSGKSS
jgi:hypothetical protein